MKDARKVEGSQLEKWNLVYRVGKKDGERKAEAQPRRVRKLSETCENSVLCRGLSCYATRNVCR